MSENINAELDKMTALAEAASPGEWTIEEHAQDENLDATYTLTMGEEVVTDLEFYPSAPLIEDARFMVAAQPAAILRIAALVSQQAARIAELEARQRPATDEEVAAWADRHDIANRLGSEARSAFEDAASLHLTFKEGK